MTTEPQTMACWKGEDCEKCNGRDACPPEPAEACRYCRAGKAHPPECVEDTEEWCNHCNGAYPRQWAHICGETAMSKDAFIPTPYCVSTLPERPRPVDKDVERTEGETTITPQGRKALQRREQIEAEKFSRCLEEFQAEINKALNGKAEDKGYSAGGDSGGRPMLDAVALIAGEGTHPIGEILYKVARWKAKRNPEDLVKVAAWAFLLWDQQKREAR